MCVCLWLYTCIQLWYIILYSTEHFLNIIFHLILRSNDHWPQLRWYQLSCVGGIGLIQMLKYFVSCICQVLTWCLDASSHACSTRCWIRRHRNFACARWSPNSTTVRFCSKQAIDRVFDHKKVADKSSDFFPGSKPGSDQDWSNGI